MEKLTIEKVELIDLRFPTSLDKTGSDARSSDPDYSCVYLRVLTSDKNITGVATVFTLGRGNSAVLSILNNQKRHILGLNLEYITQNFLSLYYQIVDDGQLCWNGPDKGLCHQANAGLINVLWDIWAKYEKKPVWSLISEMSPDHLIGLLPLKYLEDVFKKEDVLSLFTSPQQRPELTRKMTQLGYPYYVTCGWSGYSNETIKTHLLKNIEDGVQAFKMKVGQNLHDDCLRANFIRNIIGTERMLSMDANGVWDKATAIRNMKQLKKYHPYWIEEPTHPDDILAHADIAEQIKPVLVATGEQCSNRIMFKQFLQAKGLSILQTDIQRLAGLTEWLSVMLLCQHFRVKFCLHAGGVGLPQMGAHLCLIDYICFSGSTDGKYAEYIDCLGDHFITPVKVNRGCYLPPEESGFGLEIKSSSLEKYRFPEGNYWSSNQQTDFLAQKGWI